MISPLQHCSFARVGREVTSVSANEKWCTVDNYITNLLVRPEPALNSALAASTAAGLPAINVSAPQGKLLQILAQLSGAKRILEIGTLGGYSTIWLARALPPEGRLITLELEKTHADVARENIAAARLSSKVDFRIGPATELLAQLVAAKEAPFDLIFIDADKQSYPEYLKWSLELSKPGTLIIADNIIRDGAVIDPNSKDDRVQAVRRFNEMAAAERRLSATAIQTVGSKGYDGFVIALVGA